MPTTALIGQGIVPFDPYWNDILEVSNKQSVGRYAALNAHSRPVEEVIPVLPEKWGEILITLLNQSAFTGERFTMLERSSVDGILATNFGFCMLYTY
jgi:hypothetical protein